MDVSSASYSPQQKFVQAMVLKEIVKRKREPKEWFTKQRRVVARAAENLQASFGERLARHSEKAFVFLCHPKRNGLTLAAAILGEWCHTKWKSAALYLNQYVSVNSVHQLHPAVIAPQKTGATAPFPKVG